VAVFAEGRHADKVIEYYFKNNRKWGKRDRQFVAEAVYGCVRWWLKYEFVAESFDDDDLKKAHKAIAAHLILGGEELPEWYSLLVDRERVLGRAANIPSAWIRESFPEWLYKAAGEELGEAWPGIASELNRPARVVLRVNTLKTSRDGAIAALGEAGIEAVPLADDVPDAVALVKRANVFSTEAFQKGFFEMQDGSSQLVGPFLNPQPGERVIDACAGAGGKSLHLAALMKNKGKLISLDVVDWKLEELKKRARRAGVSIIEPRVIESTKVIKRLHESADAVLLDVPCSGLGVLKRTPDSKWKLNPESMTNLRVTQRDILASYSLMVKKGGRLVYSTCSVLPSENQQQVDAFVAAHPEWTKTGERIVVPQERGFDGFYMARLERAK